ncbi:MAG: hypothetical protein LC109_10940, partial [Bacteroidia bacterium]|nr:hypothetical protein [Bacteroidia bacterium]
WLNHVYLSGGIAKFVLKVRPVKKNQRNANSTYPKVAEKCFVGQFCVYLNGSSPNESWCVKSPPSGS